MTAKKNQWMIAGNRRSFAELRMTHTTKNRFPEYIFYGTIPFKGLAMHAGNAG